MEVGEWEGREGEEGGRREREGEKKICTKKRWRLVG